MVLLEIVALSALPGLLLGGSLQRLAKLPFRYGWLIILAVLVQAYVVYSGGRESVSGLAFSGALLLASYAAVLVSCALNRRLPGMPLVIVGLLLNFAVMAANGGFMPVTPEALRESGFLSADSQPKLRSRPARSKDVILPAGEARLEPLSDVLVLSPPLPFHSRYTHGVFSVGDVSVALGAFVLLQAALDSRLAVLKLRPA